LVRAIHGLDRGKDVDARASLRMTVKISEGVRRACRGAFLIERPPFFPQRAIDGLGSSGSRVNRMPTVSSIALGTRHEHGTLSDAFGTKRSV
jgi:hypothetical protein